MRSFAAIAHLLQVPETLALRTTLRCRTDGGFSVSLPHYATGVTIMGTMLGLSRAGRVWRTVVLFAALPWLAACTLGHDRRTHVLGSRDFRTGRHRAVRSRCADPVLPQPARAWSRSVARQLHSSAVLGRGDRHHRGCPTGSPAPARSCTGHGDGSWWTACAWPTAGWATRSSMDVASPASRTWPDGSAQIDAQATWRVPLQGVETAIIEESSSIRAYPLRDGQRRIVIEVRLRALRSGVQLAGTDDEKGYGGVSMRFGRAEQLDFFSDGRALQPLVAAVRTGEEVAFRWPAPVPGWPGSRPCPLPGERTALAKLGAASRAQHAELRISGSRTRCRATGPAAAHRGRARALSGRLAPARQCCAKNTHLIPVAAVIKSANVTGVINRYTSTEHCCCLPSRGTEGRQQQATTTGIALGDSCKTAVIPILPAQRRAACAWHEPSD